MEPTNYKIIEKLGSGGYGTVYSAIYNGSMIAIKKYKDSKDSMSIEIMREIAVLFGSHNGHIVSAIFVSITDEIQLGMEYWGSSLRRYIRKTKTRARIKGMETLLTHTCKALSYLHSSRIFHRDIKPDNILVKITDSGPFFKLCDFGLAKQGTGSAPFLGTGNVGTYNYRALELFSTSVCYTGSSDMWSLGCVLYEFISGELMFPGSDSDSVLDIIMETIPVSQEILDSLELGSTCKVDDFEYPPLCSDNFFRDNIDIAYLLDIAQRLISNMICINHRLTASQILSMYNIQYKKRVKARFTIRRPIGEYGKIRDSEIKKMILYDSDAHHLYIELFDSVINNAYYNKKYEFLKNIHVVSVACLLIASKFIDLVPLSHADFSYITDSVTCYDWELSVLQILKFNLMRRTIKNISLMKNYNIICDKTYNNILNNEH